ncbi:MAG: T9SS type A sorting domain-containing protein [Saprospiraceae bacterium]
MKKVISIILTCCVFLTTLQANQIRAGVISLRQVSPLTVEATIKLVTPSHVDITDLEFCWGDGICVDALQFNEEINIIQGLKYYTFINAHTYLEQGGFTTSISHCCYDAEINNIETELDAEFYLETMIVLGAELNTGPHYNSDFALVDADTAYSVFSIVGAVDDPEGDTYSNEICMPANLLNFTSMEWAPLVVAPSGGGVLVWSQPWIEGTYITQICTEEKRNGTVISRTQRIVSFMIGAGFATEVSTKEISKSDIDIFPNPVNDILHISDRGANNSPLSSISIINLQGQVALVEYQNIKNESRLDVSALAQGMYYVIVLLENGEKYYKQIYINGTSSK